MQHLFFRCVFFLLPSLITGANSETPKFGIVEPFPENIYPLEFTSVQVTCVAFDGSGTHKPVKIVFERRDEFNSYVELKANDNLRFENRTEIVDNKIKLHVTMHIQNVTLEDDSLYGALGSYECHAFAEGDVNERARHGFSVSVIRIAPWFEHEGKTNIASKTGESVTLECGAKGFPLNVEWKFENNEMVVSCINSSTDERYNITRKGVYDPYYLTVSDLVTSDTGSYYCCLPSNCSVNVDKDRCQQFVLTVKDGTMALTSHGVFVILAFLLVSSVIF